MTIPRSWLAHIVAIAACLLGSSCRSATSPVAGSVGDAALQPAEKPVATGAVGAVDSTGNSLAAAPDGDPEPSAEVYKNTIKWTTASEVDNFGFDVYRALAEDGPFERINTEVIEGAGTTDEPSSYQFVDDTIDPHKAYYYYVESISMAGVREQFTPIGRIRPKIRSEDEIESARPGGGR